MKSWVLANSSTNLPLLPL